MRSLMISSILATDMGLHFDYIKQLGNLQEKLQVNNDIDGWNGRFTEEQRSLACSLLIKCADISNVVSQFTKPNILNSRRRKANYFRHVHMKLPLSGLAF